MKSSRNQKYRLTGAWTRVMILAMGLGLLAFDAAAAAALGISPLGNELRANTTTAGEQWNYY